MKKIFLLLLISLLNIFSTKIYAQCPTAGTVTLSATSTPRTCGGNGTITATFNPTVEVALQLLKSGSIISQVSAPPSITSPYTWTGLQPGTDYQVRIICNTNNSIIYQTVNTAIADNYIPITDANISVSNLCTNFTKGGTFTVNGITGGNAPYQYSVIASDNPGYDDALSTYSSSNLLNVSDFRTYQIRVKDACGAYSTFTRTLTAALEPIRFYWKSSKVCNSNPKSSVMTSWYAYGNTTGNSVDIGAYVNPGIQMVIRDTNSSGAILFNGIYTGNSTQIIESPSHIYHVTTTNACGLSATYIHNLSTGGNPEYDDFKVVAGNSGCGASETMAISASFIEQNYWKFPVTVIIKNSAGNQVGSPVTGINYGDVANFSNLPFGTYIVTATDQCGDTLSKTVTSPQGNGTPSLNIYTYTKWRCTPSPLTQTGTTQVTVQMFGYLSDRTNAVFKIASGPSNVGMIASKIEGQYWGWSNMLPGNYSVSVTTCGVEKFYPLNIPPTVEVLQQSLISTAKSFCSSGGNISSTKVYTGSHPNTVELLNSVGNVIATQIDGNFTNIPPGTYTTRLKVTACPSTSALNIYYISGSTITITNSATGPNISASTGVVCEDALGVPLNTGSAYLDLAGVAPYTIDYRIKDSGSAFTTITTSNSSLQISNLLANSIYEVILKDSCGGNYPTTVQIKTMGALAASNTAQPCDNSPYTLIMPYYAGANYKWIDPAGNTISSTRTHTIANYTSSNNGTYVCQITWSNCVTRFINLTLNSEFCGGPIICPTNNTFPTFKNSLVYSNATSFYTIACGTITADLSALQPTASLPSGTVITWHTDPVATTANRINPANAVNGTAKYYAAFYTTAGGCYSATKMVLVVAPICAMDDDYTAINIIEGIGGSLPSIFGNDTYNGILISTMSANSVDLFYEVWNSAYAVVDGNGNLNISSNTPAGSYEYVYKICDKDSDILAESSCSYATVKFNVITCSGIDSDGDGVADMCDLDDDNDGILDTDECPTVNNSPLYHLFDKTPSNTTDQLWLYKQEDGIGSPFVCPSPGCQAATNGGLYSTVNITGKVTNLAYDDGKYYVISPTGRLLYTSNIFTGQFADIGFANIPTGNFYNLAYDKGVFYHWRRSGQVITLYRSTNPVTNGWTSMGVVNGRSYSFTNTYLYELADIAVYNGVFYFMYYSNVPITPTSGTNRTRVFESSLPTSTNPNWQAKGSAGFGSEVYNIAYGSEDILTVCDTDRDGIPNYLDLDSDNDGCTDAIEGAGEINDSQLQTAIGTLTVGVGSTAANQNLGNIVDSNGVPVIINGGQAIGVSQNALVSGCVCYKPVVTLGNSLDTTHGISAFGRAGTGNGNWPMVRKGAWTALEAKTKGFVVNRIPTTAQVNSIPNPVEGMMVYDEEADCLKIYTTSDSSTFSWKCFTTQTCPTN